MNGNKIVISGLAGSGKSTVGKLLASKLNWKFISMGDFSRKYAFDNHKMDINQFQEHCFLNPEIDKALDKEFISFCNNNNRLIVDYRLGFHFLKNTYTVLLEVGEQEAYRRINAAGRLHEDGETIKRRNHQMLERFQNKYQVNFIEASNHNLPLNTDHRSPEEIVKIILSNYNSFKNK